MKPIFKSIEIHAPADKVWEYLTIPSLMKEWMQDDEIVVDIYTDWIVGNPIAIKGMLHQIPFENTGTVLQYIPGKLLQYSHLSSISQLDPIPTNYTLLTFELSSTNNQTKLLIHLSQFPTESIYKHLEFYWNGTLKVMKEKIEIDFGFQNDD